MHSDFSLKLDIVTAEDMVVELGFSPSEVTIINTTDNTRLDWSAELGVSTHIAVDGTRSQEAGAVSAYAGATVVGYDDATVPSYKNVDSGAAIDKDLYIQIARLAKTVVDIPGSTITTTFSEGVKTLSQRLPKLDNSSDNGNTYLSRPGFMIDVSVASVVADGKTILILAKR